MGRILSNEKSKNTIFYQLLFRKYYSKLIVYNDKHMLLLRFYGLGIWVRVSWIAIVKILYSLGYVVKQLFSIPRLLHRGILAFLPCYNSLFLEQVTQGKEKCRCHGAFNKLIQKLCCYFYYVLCVENDSQSLAHTQGIGS